MNIKISFIISILLASCASQSACPPSECKPAKDGFSRYKPVIEALEKYKGENKDFPSSIDMIIPIYITRIPSSANDQFIYKKYTGYYELGFTYSGPGINYCKYNSKIRKWMCSGNY